MELCYIWVSEFKGFHNQGFNFSYKYAFNFDGNSRFLTRGKNPNYIKDFYGHSITNVTGIIGRNASGKTNILELIQYVFDGANTIMNKPFFVVLRFGNRFIIHNYKVDDVQHDFVAEIISYQGKISGMDSIFFSNVFDGRRYNFGKRIKNISTNDLLNSQFGENINTNYQKTIQKQLVFINSPDFEILEKVEHDISKNYTHNLKPTRVILTSPIWSSIINRIRIFENKLLKLNGEDFGLRFFATSFRKKITDNKSINSIKYFSAFLVFVDFIINRDVLRFAEGNTLDKRSGDYIKLKSLLTQIYPEMRIDEMYKFFTNEFAIVIDREWGLFETMKFLVELDNRDFGVDNEHDFREDIGAYASRRIQFNLKYNDGIGFFLRGYLNAVTNQSLSYNIEWAGISSGHKAYINLFSNFYSIANDLKESHVIICIDEGDLYFHPKWQTEFLYKLVYVLPKILKRPCQLILTTHSPFLVSDLPKSNLIFLEKSDDGYLTVMDNNKIEGETFGGNIGELYLDAFFMKGSLISHFAVSKIQPLVQKLRSDNSEIVADDRLLLEQIGEDLIKSQIKNLINDKDKRPN